MFAFSILWKNIELSITQLFAFNKIVLRNSPTLSFQWLGDDSESTFMARLKKKKLQLQPAAS